MAWQDDPVVSTAQPAWMNDPIARQAASTSEPQAYPNTSPLREAFRGASRALETNLPFVDRAVAAAKTYLPQGYGGSRQDYATNLALERAKNAAFEQQNPWTTAAAGVVASAPLLMAGGPSLGLGGVAGRVASSAIPVGLAGGFQGASSSPDLTNIPETAARAAIGAGEGAAVGAAVPSVASALGKIVSPFSISPERQAMVNALTGAGVPVTAGQAAGSDLLRNLEASGVGAKQAGIDQGQAFTKAVMEKGGIPAENASQKAIADAKGAISKTFDDLGARNTLMLDGELRQDIGNAVGNYRRLGGSAPGVEKAANDLLASNSPIVEGDAYNAMRSRLGKDAQSLRKSDPVQAQAYRDMQGALDDAMDRAIGVNNPDDLGAFREARRTYGNFQDVSRAASKITGDNAAQGAIPPSRLQTVLSSGNKAGNYAAGEGDLSELARAGAGILTPNPSTGLLSDYVRHMLARGLIGVGGSAAGSYYGGPRGALEGAVLGLALPKAAGTIARSPVVQNYLKNQFMSGAVPEAVANRAALAAALYARPRVETQLNRPPSE